MQVLKFGGTSVASPENITKIKNILAGYSGKQIIVVSAFGGVTDELINASELAKQQDTSYKIVLNKIESRHLETIKILIPVTNQSKVLSTVKKELNILETLLDGAFFIGEITNKLSDKIVSYGELLSSYSLTFKIFPNDVR